MGSHVVGDANPYFPGNLEIVNATILQTIQIGDDTTRAPPGVIDVLRVYCDLNIGATTLDHDRNFSLYTQAGLVELTGDGTFLFDAYTKNQTQTTGAVRLITDGGAVDVKGGYVQINDVAGVILGAANYLAGQYMTMDTNQEGAHVAGSIIANIYMGAPIAVGAATDVGLYIAPGYDVAIWAGGPMWFDVVTIMPSADPTVGGSYPLDFQMEGFGVAGVGTAGVYTQGRVINMEYGAARTLDGALEAIHIDFTANLTHNGNGVTGINLTATTAGENNLSLAEAVTQSTGNTTAFPILHRAGLINYTSILVQNNGAGSLNADNVPVINLTLDMDQTAGPCGRQAGVFSTSIRRIAGTPTLQGSMITLETTGAGALSGDFTGYLLGQAWAHDNAGADTLRGMFVSWTGDLPGGVAAFANLAEFRYTGQVGAAGALGTVTGMYVNFTNVTHTNSTVYGGRIYVDAQPDTSNSMFGLDISRDISITAAGAVATAYANNALRVMETINDVTAGIGNATNNTDMVLFDRTLLMNRPPGAVNPEAIGGRLLSIHSNVVATTAQDVIDLNSNALDITYEMTLGAGVINLNATDISRIVLNVPAGVAICTAGAGNLNFMHIDAALFIPGATFVANTDVSAIRVNLVGGNLGADVQALSLTGIRSDMPVNYTANGAGGAGIGGPAPLPVYSNASFYGTGHGNNIGLLTGATGIQLNYTEAVIAADTKAGIRISTNSNIANAANAVWDAISIDMTNIVFAGAAHAASGLKVNMVAGTDHAIYMLGAPAFITSFEQAMTIRTTRVAAGAGNNINITCADGVAGGNGGGLVFTLGAGVGPGNRNGGGIQITGGNSDNLGIAGGFQFTGGTGSGAGSVAGSVALYTGPPNGGTRGTIDIGNANAGIITIGNAASLSALLLIGGTTLNLSTNTGNISINPGSGAVRAFTTLNDTGIINGRWEATQIHDGDDFQGTVVDPKWTNTLVLNGTITMLIGANSVEGGAVRLAVTGVNTDQATLSRGTNRFGNTARRMVYEVRLSPSNIAAASRTRISVKMWNNGAFGGAGSYLGFEFEPNAAANWFMCGANAGAANRVDTGVAVGAGAYVTLRFEITAAGTCQAYINGVAAGAAVPAANVPAALLEPYIEILNDAAGQAATLDVDYEREWQTRPVP